MYLGVRRVDVQVRNTATGQYLTAAGTFSPIATWIAAFVTNPGGAGSNYNYATPTLPPGPYLVSARATDSVGQIQPVPNTATVTVVAG